MQDDALSYVVGEEKGLGELLLDSEVQPLLEGMLAAGATSAAITDQDGDELWIVRDPARLGKEIVSLPIKLEGEPVGALRIGGPDEATQTLICIARLLGVAIDTLLCTNLKRMLTTEIHTNVVNSSYDELMETNRKLTESEMRYRKLAESLEQKVKERTSELKKAHAHLLQQEKMAAVGQLAAGIAHEINNPLGFITSNLHTLQKYVSRLITMVEYQKTLFGVKMDDEAKMQHADHKWQELKLNSILTDVGDLLHESLNGAERVTRIVADLKGFSHVDELGAVPVDINAELERTLSVLTHELGTHATIVREFQPLPLFPCMPAILGQVFLNIIMNARQAKPSGLKLTLSTAWDGERIRISIADNGPGIPHDIRAKIFEPFFTTREVGSGTGMGLAVVYDTVLKLGGMVAVTDSAAGGADFIITIPVRRD